MIRNPFQRDSVLIYFHPRCDTHRLQDQKRDSNFVCEKILLLTGNQFRVSLLFLRNLKKDLGMISKNRLKERIREILSMWKIKNEDDLTWFMNHRITRIIFLQSFSLKTRLNSIIIIIKSTIQSRVRPWINLCWVSLKTFALFYRKLKWNNFRKRLNLSNWRLGVNVKPSIHSPHPTPSISHDIHTRSVQIENSNQFAHCHGEQFEKEFR